MIIFLDYDGTLTPIVQHPKEAKIDRHRKEFLTELSKKHTVVIVTGRDIRSFKEVFGDIPKTLYVITSHGAKIYRDGKLVKNFFKGKIPDLSELREQLKGMRGVFLEEKDGCFALHYRGLEEGEDKIKKIFRDFVEKFPPVRIIEGKKVLEGIYGEFDKGRGVENFLRFIGWRGKEPVIYIGDDTTDFYAFKKVRELGGKAIFVGKGEHPEVDLVLEDVDHVYEFLTSLDESIHDK